MLWRTVAMAAAIGLALAAVFITGQRGGERAANSPKTAAQILAGIDPADATAYGLIGDAEMEQGDYDQAREHYKKMIALRPDRSSYSRGGQLLWLTGHRSEAIRLLEKAIRTGGADAETTARCRATLAMMLFDDGAFVPAWQTLQPALAAAPRSLPVLLAAGRVTSARHDYGAAAQFYQRALAVAPNIAAFAALGDLRTVQGEKAEAEKYYQQVEALHAANLAAGQGDHLEMARFYADHDRHLAEAVRLAEPNKLTRNVREADTLAWVYFKHGDQARAEEAIKRALSHGNLDPTTQFHAGMIAAKKGDLSAARRYLAAALNFNPEFSLLEAPIARTMLQKLGRGAGSASAPPAPRR